MNVCIIPDKRPGPRETPPTIDRNRPLFGTLCPTTFGANAYTILSTNVIGTILSAYLEHS